MNRLKALVLLLMVALPAVGEEEFEWRKLYVGGGFGSVEVPQVSETQSALQIFVGYPLERISSHYVLSVETGYIDVSDYPYSRYWGTAVLTHVFSSELELSLRLGVEAGNNRGFFTPTAALGVSHRLDDARAIRLEVIERADSPSVFLNLLYHP